MTPDELPADMEGRLTELRLAKADIDNPRPEFWEVDLARYKAARADFWKTMNDWHAASPVVPVGSGETLPPISLDGPHKIGEHRRWLAQQLLDSRQDDAEAYSTVIYSPAMTDIWRDYVVPVGVRERVLDELDKAWLHGQRRTSWRRDKSADAILAVFRPTDTGRE
jgi:hypothetical protein